MSKNNLKEPSVDFIILNWNGYKDTSECLDSLKEIEYSNYQVYVVDNASTDNSLSFLEPRYPGIKFLRSENNLGFAGGNNFGIRQVWDEGHEYMLLLNNDTTVDKFFLRDLVEAGSELPKGGIFCPLIYDYDKKDKVAFWGGYFDEVKGPVFETKYDLLNCHQDKPYSVQLISGCCMLIRREVVEEIGMLDDKYFIYHEEADYCYRASKKGWQFYMVPRAKIWHKVGASAGDTMSSVMSYYIPRNLLYFVSKNYRGFLKRMTFKVNFYPNVIVTVVKWLMRKKFSLVKYTLIGIKDYFFGRMGKYRGTFSR